MEKENITQVNPEATQNNGENVGTQPTTGHPETKIEGKTYSQSDVDEQMRKTRLATEKDAKKKLLAQLGLTLDDEDKLNAFKEAYQNSLSEEDKRNAELQNLQAEKLKLTQDLEEKDYVIKALIALSGKNEADVDKIVKMAKGLKTEDNTIEDAINEVISMVNVEKPQAQPANKEQHPPIPTSIEIQQPSTSVVIDTTENPFKAGQINLTKQGKILRENPELAKKLAAEAGVTLHLN